MTAGEGAVCPLFASGEFTPEDTCGQMEARMLRWNSPGPACKRGQNSEDPP